MAAWQFRGGKIFAAFDIDEQNFVPFSCRFEVIEKKVNILTNLESIVVRISNGYSNPQVTMQREAISEGTIVDELTKYGVSLSNQKPVRLLVKQILTDTEDSAKKTMEFNKLGFVEINGTEFFAADRLYCAEKSDLTVATCSSTDMMPKGTLQQYRRFLINEVSKHPKLALAFALGVTAPVAHILKKYGAFYETVLWCFCGESSSGKTTSLLAMLSVFGSPQYLLSNLNATSNALSAQISAQSGFPFVADEATRSKVDFDELIYSLSSGKGKRRCNGDGTLKSIVNFSGAAFFSSEQPILDKCSEQGGEEARVIEFELDWFDGDGDKAERFLRFFNSHYGTATAPLAELLLNQKIQRKIVRHFLRAQKALAKKVKVKDGIDKRIVQRLAIVAVACWLLQKALKVDLHIEGIVDLLISVFEEKQTRICRIDGTERLLQLFVEDYIHNKEKYGSDFNTRKSARHASFTPSLNAGSLRGMASTFQGRSCLWLPSDTFNEILNRQTTYGASTAKKKLNEKGHLQKFGNAYYHWFNFGATSANAYCVFLPQQDEVLHENDSEKLDNSMHSLLVAGFVALTAQQTSMVLNKELGAKLGITSKKKLFLHVWADKGFCVLSTKPSDKAVALEFEKINDIFVATNDRMKNALRVANLNVRRRECLFFSDISVVGKTPSATIYFDNPHGQLCEKINDSDPYRIPIAFSNSPCISLKNRRSLLEDDNNI